MKKIALLFILLLLLLLSLSLAENVYFTINTPVDDHKPVVELDFVDIPVTITSDYYLVDESGNREPYDLIFQAFACTLENSERTCVPLAAQDDSYFTFFRFSLRSDDYLFNGDYTFYVQVQDEHENEMDVFINFTIDSATTPIFLTNPTNSFQTERSTFGMAQEAVFDLSIYVPLPSVTCRYGLADYIDTSGLGTNPQSVFARLTGTFANSGDHKNWVDANFGELASLGVPEGELTQLLVMCDHGSEQTLSFTMLDVGYDTTAPVFLNASITPATILSLDDLDAIFSIETDDRTFCTYANTRHPGGIGQHPFNNEDPSSLANFTTEKAQELHFIGGDYPEIRSLTDPETFTFEATCTNVAGLQSIQEVDLIVDLADEVIITMIHPVTGYISPSSPFSFTTQINAQCSLSIDGTEVGTTTNTKSHQINANVEEGTHDYLVECSQPGYGSDSQSGSITVDTQLPLAINITDYTTVLCGAENTIQATFVTSDTDIHHYVYTIGGEEHNTSSLSISESVESEPGDSHTLAIKPVDLAGNVGPAASVHIPHRATTDPSCDRTPPTTWMTEPALREAGDGYNVTIQCDDGDGTGCQDQVKLYLEEYGQSCEATNLSVYTQTEKVDELFHITENGKMCWVVADKGSPANIAFGERNVAANIGIEVINPSFGISPDKTFALHVSTLKIANCRQGSYIAASHDGKTAVQHYNDLNARGDSTLFEVTGATSHTITNFNGLSRSDAEYQEDWLFACQGEGLYTSVTIPLGYDTTPPEVVVLLDPNPLREPSETFSDLAITVDEDSLCTYVQPTASPYSPPASIYNFNDPNANAHTDLTKREHYTSIYEIRLPEDENRYFTIASAYAYSYKIKCTNLAGRITEQGFDVEVDPLQQIAVDFHTSEYQRTTSIKFNATTIGRSDCTLSIEGLEPFEMASSDNYYHMHTVTLQEGVYAADVTCTSSISSQVSSGSSHKTIHVDTKSPTQTNVTAPKGTCGLSNRPELRIQVADGLLSSGIDHYEIVIDDGENTTEFNTTQDYLTLPLDTPMTAGTSYSVKVRPIDRAGNVGVWSTAVIIIATDDKNLLCDTINPTGWVTLEDTYAGATATIHCSDSESGCAGNYRYALISKDNSCDEATLASKALTSTVAITADQLLCWEVADLADNTYAGETDITVSLDISLKEPLFGVGKTATYDLTYATDRTAECRIGFLNPNHPSNLLDWYNQLQSNLETNASEHTYANFNIGTFGATRCVGAAECTEDVVIICTENGRYHYAINEIGHDTTPPVISTSAVPNPVVEPGALQSTLMVSSDDATWCSYESAGQSYGFYQYPDPTDLQQYLTSHEKSLGYLSPPPAGQSSYTKDYVITCRNKAQALASKIVSLTVTPSNTVTITINTKREQGTKTIILDVSTDLQSTCSYTFDPNQPAKPFAKTGDASHTTSHTFSDEGIYEVIVYCEALSGPYEGSNSKELVVDATGPTMVAITANAKSCSLTTLSATLAANASIVGLSAFNYTVTAGEETVIPWTKETTSSASTISASVILVTGVPYILKAQAIDNLGRKSTIITKTITGSDANDASCDTTKPTASMDIKEVYGGVDAYVTCDDGLGSCTDYYDFQHSVDSCEEEGYATELYVDSPVRITSTGRACAIVYDEGTNSDSVEKSFTIYEHCSNGIQDAAEDGIDCGGQCPLECNICSNGRQDVVEEGVDCGGLCPTTCVNTCGDSYLQAGEECDGTTVDTSCVDLRFANGTATCDDDCKLDTTACIPALLGTCGDGKVDAGEQCDGGVLNLACEDFGLGSGTLSCSSSCKITTTSCEGTAGECGDGVIGPGETCDDDFQGMTCENFGLRSGTLNCQACSIVTNSCYPGTCGDGIIDPSESCDGLNWGTVTACEDISTDFLSGTPTCLPSCHFDTTTCVAKETPLPGGPSSICLQDTDCNPGYVCEDNVCEREYIPPPIGPNGTGPVTPIWPDEPEDHTTGKILLFIGIFLIVAGGAFLAVDKFVQPIGPQSPVLGGSMPTSPTGPRGSMPTPVALPDDPQTREALLAQEKRKLALQRQAKAKAQLEKAKDRESILSSFKEGGDEKPAGDEMDAILERLKAKTKQSAERKELLQKARNKQPSGVKPDKKIPVTKEVDLATKEAAVTKPIKKKVTEKPKDDIFSKLDTINTTEEKKVPLNEEPFKALAELSEKPTNKELFDHVANIGGKPITHVKKTLNSSPNADALTALFSDGKKKDVNHKTVAPALTHLIKKGKIEHAVAHKTVHNLAGKNKLTDNQRDKIIDQLKELGLKK